VNFIPYSLLSSRHEIVLLEEILQDTRCKAVTNRRPMPVVMKVEWFTSTRRRLSKRRRKRHARHTVLGTPHFDALLRSVEVHKNQLTRCIHVIQGLRGAPDSGGASDP
jgi:hypothetical protein